MSNYLAIATTTETIAQIIRDAVGPTIPGAEVTTGSPERAAKDSAARVNVFLYQVTPNPALRNASLPTRATSGTLIARPQTALDLSYIISFYGKDEQLVTQQLMALTVIALHTRALIERDDIVRAIRAAPGGFLDSSDLVEQTQAIKLAPIVLALEELSKLWSVMFQIPYAPSVAYHCSVVLLDGLQQAARALPARAAVLTPAPWPPPTITRITDAAGNPEPFVIGDVVVLSGNGFTSRMSVDVGGAQLAATSVSPDGTEMRVSLVGEHLTAGPQSLVVLAEGVRSNTVSVPIRPTIVSATVRDVTASGPLRNGVLVVRVSPAGWNTQSIGVLLNAVASGGVPPATGAGAPPRPRYRFDSRTAQPPVTTPAREDEFVVPFTDVERNTYLIRVVVSGAESPLHAQQTGAGWGPFDSPVVAIA